MVESLGEAHDLGWEIFVKCAAPNREGLKLVRQCLWSYRLDMHTMIATRGRNMPLVKIGERIKCPRCGSMRIAVMFSPPPEKSRNSQLIRAVQRPR